MIAWQRDGFKLESIFLQKKNRRRPNKTACTAAARSALPQPPGACPPPPAACRKKENRWSPGGAAEKERQPQEKQLSPAQMCTFLSEIRNNSVTFSTTFVENSQGLAGLCFSHHGIPKPLRLLGFFENANKCAICDNTSPYIVIHMFSTYGEQFSTYSAAVLQLPAFCAPPLSLLPSANAAAMRSW